MNGPRSQRQASFKHLPSPTEIFSYGLRGLGGVARSVALHSVWGESPIAPRQETCNTAGLEMGPYSIK